MFDRQLALEFPKWHPDALEVFERRVFARLLAKDTHRTFPGRTSPVPGNA